MLSQKDEITKINNRLECSEANLKYHGDKLSDIISKCRGLTQQNEELKKRIDEQDADISTLAMEISALRDCLDLREAGTSVLELEGERLDRDGL